MHTETIADLHYFAISPGADAGTWAVATALAQGTTHNACKWVETLISIDRASAATYLSWLEPKP